MPPKNIDDLSLLLGEMKSDIKHIRGMTEKQETKITRIDSTLTNHRIKVAGIAGTTSIAGTAIAYTLMQWLKSKFGS
ncbi:hypothetical protein KAR91_04175 [Candidatus Pacearchaeota archaeon]|nr:hypothetical protein [Candidatus Pacearchaeota archaeon]